MSETQRGRGAIILLARLDSSRLPGKQLLGITEDRNLLDLLVERLQRSRHRLPLILATSNRGIDNPLAEFATTKKIALFRGDLNNVAKRCLDCTRQYGLDWFVRICGDSPFTTPEIVDEVVDTFLESDCDLACNVFPRTWPVGASAEAISQSAMARICRETSDISVLEHVTAHAYKNAGHFAIENVERIGGSNDLNKSLAVDTPEDLERARWIAGQLDDPITATLEMILEQAGRWSAS